MKIRMIKVTLYPTEGTKLEYARSVSIEVPDAERWIALTHREGCDVTADVESHLKNLAQVIREKIISAKESRADNRFLKKIRGE